MKHLLTTVSLAVLLLFPSCKEEPAPVEPEPPGSTGKITTGPATEVARQTIAATGGTLRVIQPGDPLDGLELLIPQNAFSRSQEFAVSGAEILSHQLGAHFHPISPLIRIGYEGGYADELMTLRIPITLPSGHFAMGFFYDETTGELEGIPVLDLDSASITLSTRHFSRGGESGGGLFRPSQPVWTHLVVSSALWSLIRQQPMLSSGFTPGIDDWEFPNYGSYIAPGGHCAGQSMAAMWYYYEQKRKRGKPALYHEFDTRNISLQPGHFWFDNPRGYRFASTIQEDLDFTDWITKLDALAATPYVSWRCFILAMLVTGEPQFVIVKNSATDAGHAMVVYAVSPLEEKLYVADPNYPSNRNPDDGTETIRAIQYHSTGEVGTFDPYRTGLTAAAPGVEMDQIGYAAKSSHIDWSQIGRRWAEVDHGTIGDDRFPAYALRVSEGGGSELREDFLTRTDSIVLHCQSAGCDGCIPGTADLQEFEVHEPEGFYVGKADASTHGLFTLKLRPGEQRVGFYVTGRILAGTAHYLDFTWRTIRHHVPMDLVSTDEGGRPIAIPGLKNTIYHFVARPRGVIPPEGTAAYTWDFGDGTAPATFTDDSTAEHSFAQGGSYRIQVVLRADTMTWGTASADAVISLLTDPIITGVVPGKARIYDTLSVRGAFFGTGQSGGQVFFAGRYGDIEATEIPQWSDTQIRVRIPRATDSGYVSVLAGGVRSNRFAFTLDRTPWIDSLWRGYAQTHPWGLPGRGMGVKGRNFWFGEPNPPRVRFGRVTVEANSWMWNSIGVSVPGGDTGAVELRAISSAGLESNAADFFIGVPFDTLRAHPQANVAISLASSYYDQERGSTVRQKFGSPHPRPVPVAWDTSGFTLDVKDLDENKEGTLRVTFPKHGMRIATLTLDYASHQSPNEQIHYSAEGIGYRLSSLPTQGELLMEFFAQGYEQVQSVTTAFRGTVTPAQNIYELQGLDPAATSLISIMILDLDVH